MDKIILIKYGELTTKKGNLKYFVDTLYNNIKYKLKDLEVNIIKERFRTFIEFNEKDLEEIVKRLSYVFGIHSIVIGYKTKTDIEDIKDEALKLLKNEKFTTFKVETKRSYKNFSMNSLEISKVVGGYILKNIDNIKVDVHIPDLILKIEIRKDNSYIYLNEIMGLGGYPTGTQEKGLLMLSGGLDSPVAGYLSLKRGIKLACIYFEAIPHTSIEARNKVINLIKKLVKHTDEITLYIVPFTKIQETIYKNVDPSYMITIMRRMMYRISDKLAKKQKNLILINGESIGQVASQTLTSIAVINEVTNMPVIRPVACMDKIEIINIAKKIDTYDISILPFEDCCTVFVPKHPVINPKLDKAIAFEKTFDFNFLIDEAIANILTISITDRGNIDKNGVL
ncbi:MAG: tRNA 4-thiouridine(8) synthase ThiI [Bacilli bacterium]|nr:tRNA 4-thiouridine(8) synthase ThiI [Bacilli bacterium]